MVDAVAPTVGRHHPIVSAGSLAGAVQRVRSFERVILWGPPVPRSLARLVVGQLVTRGPTWAELVRRPVGENRGDSVLFVIASAPSCE